MRRRRAGLGLSLGLLLLSASAQAQTTPTFDLSEIQKEIRKKPFSLGGFLESESILFGLDRDAALYRLRLYDRDEGKHTEEYNFRLRLEGKYQEGIASLHFKTNSLLRYSYQGTDEETSLYEGFLSLRPDPGLSVDAGKKVLKWGKGYAWNPVAFVDRPKNPEDPDEALEGYWVLTADLVRSFSGPLQTIAFTPVVFPAYDHLNADFGKKDHLNFAGKLYLLWWDTDIDFLFLAGGSRTPRYGFDFSKNLKSNLEVHGEWALIKNFERRISDSAGRISTRQADALSALLGLRYLTENDITFIAEYYRDGTGYQEDELRDFYQFVHNAYGSFLSSGSEDSLRRAQSLAQQGYGRPNPGRNYFYVRASQKEPYDILYFTPALASIVNLGDHSFTLIPELLYSPRTNLELRLRGSLLNGASQSEYGEKQNDFRLDFRVRYYF